MDPFASKLGFASAAVGAAVLGAMFPRPSYDLALPARPWANAATAQAWQPVSGMAERFSYSGAMPSDRGPIDVYGAHGWALARDREILARQDAELKALMAVRVEEPSLTVEADHPPAFDNVSEDSAAAQVTVHRGRDSQEEPISAPVVLAMGE